MNFNTIKKTIIDFSETLALVLPTNSTINRDTLTNIKDGTTIFNPDTKKLEIYNSGVWVEIGKDNYLGIGTNNETTNSLNIKFPNAENGDYAISTNGTKKYLKINNSWYRISMNKI